MSDVNRIPAIGTGADRADERARRTTAIAIAVIVGVAAGLRLWSIGGGLPSSLGVDEPQIMVRSLTMVKTGDFNPHFFDYPGLYLYLQAAVIVARFMVGAADGTWSSLAQVSDYDFYLWGRVVTAAFGTATVFLVYRAGTRWGARTGLLAAAVFAVMPIHVRESHYVLTDVPMTFFVTLALVLSFRAVERRSVPAFVWAGAAAGLAAATKYTAWVSLLMPLVAAAFAAGPAGARFRNALTAIAGFGAAFLVAAPYTVLDLPGFLNGFGALSAGVPRRPVTAAAGWVIYLKHLRTAMGWPAQLLGGMGLALFVWRLVTGPARHRYLMVLLFVAVFWSMIIDRKLIFARYLMPVLPMLALLTGVATIATLDWLRRFALRPVIGTAAMVTLVAATLVQPSISSASFDIRMGRATTESLAIKWIEENVRPGARIVHEGATLHFPAGRYRLEYAHSVADKGLDFYLGGNVDYVVATSASYGRYFENPSAFRDQYLDYQNLFQRMTPAFIVHPSTEHPGPEIRVLSPPR